LCLERQRNLPRTVSGCKAGNPYQRKTSWQFSPPAEVPKKQLQQKTATWKRPCSVGKSATQHRLLRPLSSNRQQGRGDRMGGCVGEEKDSIPNIRGESSCDGLGGGRNGYTSHFLAPVPGEKENQKSQARQSSISSTWGRRQAQGKSGHSSRRGPHSLKRRKSPFRQRGKVPSG